MTSHAATVTKAEADIRWRDWQARGAEIDRRTAKRMARLMLLIAIGSAIWLFVQIA
jgi:hypothetical protein